MAGEWREVMLADVSAEVSYGYTESASDKKVGPRFLRITDIQNGVVNWHTVPYCPISESDHQKYRLNPGDIVVARTGNSTGENYLFRGTEDAVYASYLIRFRVDQNKADPAYVWYNLRTQRWWDFINNSKTGSAQAGANAKVLGLFPFHLPPLAKQKAIAHILGTLDDKIELNRWMNETLEAMARAIFKSWFVDFDPVRRNMEWKNGKGAKGRRRPAPPEAHQYDHLFPDAFEDSELGKIPKGWQVATLARRASSIQYGFTQSATCEAVGPHFLRITDIRGGKADWSSVPYCEIEDGELEKYRIKDGDIFVARTGASAGDNVYIVDPPEAVFASYLVRFRFEPSGVARFVAEYMRSPDYFGYVEGTIGGSAQPNASAQTLAAATVAFPPEDVAAAFYQLVRPADMTRAANAQENEGLAAVRDALLPRLLNGTIRVCNAERKISHRA